MEWPAAPQSTTPRPSQLTQQYGLEKKCRALLQPLLRGKRHAVEYSDNISSTLYKPCPKRKLIRPPTAISIHLEKEVVEVDGLLRKILTVTRNVLFIGDFGPSDSLCPYIQTSRINRLKFTTVDNPHVYDLVVVGQYHWRYAKDVFALLNYLDTPVVMLCQKRDKRCDFETLIVN